MKDFIKRKLYEDLGLESSNSQNTGESNLTEGFDKYSALEADLRQIMGKYQNEFAEYEGDTYSVIEAVHSVLDGMFQKV